MFWIYNRLKNNIHKSRPKDICKENYLYELAYKKIIFDEDFIGGISKQLISIVEKMNLLILRAEEENFITSDFTVLYKTTDTDEMITVFTFIYIPISSKYALLFNDSEINSNLRNRLITINCLRTISMNSLFFSQSDEYSKIIIAKDKNNLENTIK